MLFCTDSTEAASAFFKDLTPAPPEFQVDMNRRIPISGLRLIYLPKYQKFSPFGQYTSFVGMSVILMWTGYQDELTHRYHIVSYSPTPKMIWTCNIPWIIAYSKFLQRPIWESGIQTRKLNSLFTILKWVWGFAPTGSVGSFFFQSTTTSPCNGWFTLWFHERWPWKSRVSMDFQFFNARKISGDFHVGSSCLMTPEGNSKCWFYIYIYKYIYIYMHIYIYICKYIQKTISFWFILPYFINTTETSWSFRHQMSFKSQ